MITIGGVDFKATGSGSPGTDEFTVIGDRSTDMHSLVDAINNYDWSGATNTFAASYSNNGPSVVISSTVTATGSVRAVTAGELSATYGTYSGTMVLIEDWPGPKATGKTVGSITLTGAVVGNLVRMGNTDFTAVYGAPAAFDPIGQKGQFQVGVDDAATMQNLAAAINVADAAYEGVWPHTAHDDSFEAGFDNGTGTVILYRKSNDLVPVYLDCEMSDFEGFSSSPATMSITMPPTVVYRAETLTLSGVKNNDWIAIENHWYRVGTDFAVGATDEITARNLADYINAHPGPKGIRASAVNGSSISITSNAGFLANDVRGIPAGSFIETMIVESELSTLESQYNTMRDQITALAEDSGYKGKDLLSASASLRALTVKFEGATLAVTGFDATANGLGLTAAAWSTGGSSIEADITVLENAMTILRQGSSGLAGNLSIISVRQNFSTDMINTLTAGSDKLTLADANEEGASMLMLQTRQSLSTTALSLSAQAAQSVLQLFR